MKKVSILLISMIIISSCLPIIMYDQCFFDNTSAYDLDLIIDFDPTDSLSTDSYRSPAPPKIKRVLPLKYVGSWEKRIKVDTIAVYLAMDPSSLPKYGVINPKAIKDSDLYAVIFADSSVLLSGERTMVFPPPQDETRVRVVYYNGYSSEDFK